MAGPLPTPRTLGAGPGRGPARRPPRRVWIWTAVTLVVAAVAVSLWRTSDVVATSRTTAPPATVPDEAPAAELTQVWSVATSEGPRRAVEGGRVLVTDEHGVAMLDAVTGEEAWHYRRDNATLCDATAIGGNVITAFRTTGRCNELTALSASTGERDWYRNVRFRTDVDLASTDQILLASSPTGVVTIDPAGNNTRWRYAPPTDCRLVGSDVGSSGVVVLQRCPDTGVLQVRLLDGFGGTEIWTRDVATGTSTARLAGVDRLVTVVVDDRVLVFSPVDGTPLPDLPLPALPAGAAPQTEPLQQAGVEDVALLWARGTAYALDQGTGLPQWQVPARGLPSAGTTDEAGVSTVTVPEDGAFVQRTLDDGTEVARSTTGDDVPPGGRTALLGPVVVYGTADEVLGHR